MQEAEVSLRGVLFTLALVPVLASGPVLGHLWPRHSWPTRIVLIGLAVIQVYLLAGQVKALTLNIPFDGYSWVGLVGVATLDIGLLVWVVTAKNRRREQR